MNKSKGAQAIHGLAPYVCELRQEELYFGLFGKLRNNKKQNSVKISKKIY